MTGKAARDKRARMARAFGKSDGLLFRFGQTGLQRVSQSSAVELEALGQTAHNAGLIKIEREIGVLGAHVQRYLTRDPLFRLSAYQRTVNRIWLLNRSARRHFDAGTDLDQMREVVGEARRRYERVERPLEMQVLGASGWVTDSDFVGVTLFYQSADDAVIYQVSSARPTMYFGSDPRRLLHQPLSDALPYTVHDLSHGSFAFREAKISRDHRLSVHRELGIAEAPTRGLRVYDRLRVGQWAELLDRLRALRKRPESVSAETLVYVEPAALGRMTLDDKRAVATLPILDTAGARMILTVSLTEDLNFLVDNLERLLSADHGLRPDGLFGRAWVAGGALRFFPYTAVYHQPLTLKLRGERRVNEIHLTLEPLTKVHRG